MKRTLILPIALLLGVVVAAPVVAQSDEWSVGVSLNGVTEDEGLDSAQVGFNVGYKFLNILLADWTAVSIPPGLIESWTGQKFTDKLGKEFWKEGYYRPGFVNFFDIGLAFNIGPIVATGQAGLNLLYIYRQGDLEGYEGSFGANLRAGVGYRDDWWSVILNGTVAFADLTTAVQTLAALGSEEVFLKTQAEDTLKSGLVLSLGFNLYL
jgi:hypothetical protein